MIRTTLFSATMAMLAAAGMTVPAAFGQAPVRTPAPAQAPAQAPQGQTAEAGWLDSLPGDLPIVVRVGGLERTSTNMVTMLRAMSPELAEQYGSQIQATVSEFSRSLGAGQNQAAAIVMIDVVTPDQLGDQVKLEGAQLRVRPRAIAVFQTQDYRTALASIAGQPNVQPEARDGFEVVTLGNGDELFAVQKEGFAAISMHEDLITKVSGAPESTLGQSITDDLRSHFLDGDLGLYVDLASINETYADQGAQVRGFLRQQVDQLENENPEAAEQIRSVFEQVVEAAENAKAMASNASFAEQGLSLSGKLVMNEGYEPISQLAAQGDDSAETLGTLPQGSAYYAFNMLDPENVEWDMLPSGDQLKEDFPEFAKLVESPEFDQAKEQFRKAGQMKTYASLGLGETRQGICVIEAEDAPALIEAVRSAVEAIKNREFSLIKDLTIEAEAETHEGYTFDKITASYDFDAFTKEVEEQAEKAKTEVQGQIDNDAIKQNVEKALAENEIDREDAVKLLRRVVGESTTLFVGTDGTKSLSVLAENWDDAKAQIDSYVANDKGIGQTESFQKVRAQLPDRVRSLTMVDLQTGFRQVLGEVRQATDEEVRAPQGTPEQPAFIGSSLVAEENGLRFQTFVPSEVGPVIEKGIIPLIEQEINKRQDN